MTTRVVDRVVLLGLLVVAAALRLPNLATRGTWDSDQGHDMLVLRAWVQDGVVPLLGPPTSIGDFHHGALYYYLLGPVAALTGGDSPLAVVATIAVAGIAAVAVTWGLARAIGGSIAGLVAGLLMAVSAAAIDESTFIWNPNFIALSSAIALAGAWRAWSARRARWWLVAAGGVAVTMQCHVLGIVLLPVIGALLVADARRRDVPADRRVVLLAGLAGLGLIASTYTPLAIHELTSGFSETGAALDYLRQGGDPSALDPLSRVLIVMLRVVSWPLVGLVTTAFVPAFLSLLLIWAIVVWRWRASGPDERVAIRWLGLGLLWSSLALSAGARNLTTVVEGLPNDHYHAFADPMVFVLAGLGFAGAWRKPRLRPAAIGALALLVGWNVAHLPAPIHRDGGFPAAVAAGNRITGATGGRPIRLLSLPDFKPTDAYGYPLALAGQPLIETAGAAGGEALVVICDTLFVEAIGAPCGGPAEDALLAVVLGRGARPRLVDRFQAAPGRTISVYLAIGG